MTKFYSLLFLTLTLSATAFGQEPAVLIGGRDLGFRPKEDGEQHSPSEMDPSKKNLTLKGHIIHQKGYAARAAIVRIAAWPILSAIIHSERSKGAKTYKALASEDSQLFKLFDINASRHVPNAENSSTLINNADEFEGVVENKYGFCWGVTTMNRLFAHLAFFRSDTFPEDGVPDEMDRKAWLEFYLKKLNSIVAGNAELIPGFTNMREFSLVPEFELALKKAAVKIWRDKSIQPWDRKLYRKTADSEMTSEEIESLVSDLKIRLSRNELPKLMFTSFVSPMKFGVPTWIHTVLVYGFQERSDKTRRILLWDPDAYGEDQAAKPKFLEIRPDGTILFAPWYTKDDPKTSDVIAQVYYAPDNEVETLKIMDALKTFCLAHPESCSE